MDQPISSPEQEIDLAKELAGPQTPKYTIRTMAQDLERARKEGVIPVAATKAPPAPPAIKPTPPPISAPVPKVATPPIPALATPKVPIAQAPVPSIIPPRTLEMPPAPPISTAITTPPAIPIRPSVIPPPAKKLSRISFAQLNLIISVIAVAIILIGSIGFSYWWFFVRVAPIEPVVQQPPIEEEKPEEKLPPTEPILPQGILVTDQDIIIETSVKTASTETLSSLMSQISASAKSLGDKKLARILIKYSSETEKQYLSFIESLSLLQLTIPETLNQNITNGELLAYNQNGEIRYGFSAKISDGLKTLDAMNVWKETILTDLKNIYIDTSSTKPEGATFRDNFYESFVKSFINLSAANTSLDWGVSDEKKLLIVATSKDMIYEAMNSVVAIVMPLEQSAKQTQPQNPEIAFADKLNSCTKYKTTFKHPLIGEILEKEILGIVNGKCDYIEQMPNGGKMECKYTENERKAVAQFYKDIASAQSVETNINISLGNGEQKAKYIIDGKEVENPLQEAIDSGICVISGY